LWYRIAQANGLSGSADLKPGQSLSVPAAAQPFNSADSFKPYRASEIVGDTSPNLPAPAKKGCGAIGTIIMVVVAVVATVMTAGAASIMMAGGTLSGVGVGGLMSAGATALAGGGAFAVGSAAVASGLTGLSTGAAIGAAVVGGAVGSIVSQGVGLAIGAVDKFSWRSVGLAALGAGVSSGLGAAGVGGQAFAKAIDNPYLAAAVSGGIRSAVTQGVGSVLGMQSFSWKAVAVSAATAAVGEYVGGAAGSWAKAEGLDSWGQQMARSLASGVSGGLIRAASYNHGKIDWSAIAADAFGNAIGNSVVEEITYQSELSNFKERLLSLARVSETDSTPQMVPVSRGAAASSDREADAILSSAAGGRHSPERALALLRAVTDDAVAASDARNKVWSEDSAVTNTAVFIGRALNNGAELLGAVKDAFVGAWGGLEKFGAALANADLASAQRMVSSAVDGLSALPTDLARRTMVAFDTVLDLADTAQTIAADPQMRGEVVAQARRVWSAMGKAEAAMGAADVVFTVGMAALGGAAVRAAGEAAGQVNTARIFAREARVSEQADDLMGRFSAALTNVAGTSAIRRSIATALRQGVSSDELGAALATKVFTDASLRSAKEGAGVLHAIIRMQNQGWTLVDRSFSYNGGSNHGIDLVFKRKVDDVERYAVTEAKAGIDTWRGNIKLDDANTAFGKRMQGSKDYNIDRLTKLSRHAKTPQETAELADSILSAYRLGRVDNYASFAQSDRLVRIDDSVLTSSKLSDPSKFSVLDWLKLRRT
ncbi:MAG: hypothetical protein ACK56N_12820, partial [Betaproteobacteria bacterium]